jgi:prepilin-type N-terminal cleavage/methylation domain-containing protein
MFKTFRTRICGFFRISCFGFRASSHQSGFTLMEMVVTVGIFALISTVVIVRNAQFDNETLLQNLAYDVALSVRRAQQFGVNVRASGGVFEGAYGVHFDADSPTYFAFIDMDEDGIYDGPEELLETYTLGRGAAIGNLCATEVKGDNCISQLDIVFRRPNPDAVINNGDISQATVELISGRGDGSRIISIESTGQISIKRSADEADDETGEIEL